MPRPGSFWTLRASRGRRTCPGRTRYPHRKPRAGEPRFSWPCRAACDPNPHQLALLPFLRLLLAQRLVAELVEGDLHRPGVIATVVLETGGRHVRELFGLDEILEPDVRRVHLHLERGALDQALDQVGGLRYPEGAAVGNAAGRLVRVGAVRLDVSRRDVVGAGDDVEETGP